MFCMCNWLIATFVVIALAIAFVLMNYFQIKRMKEGTADMVEMAGHFFKRVLNSEYRF